MEVTTQQVEVRTASPFLTTASVKVATAYAIVQSSSPVLAIVLLAINQAHGVETTPKTGIPDNEAGWREAGCPETGRSGFEAKQAGRPICLG